jgi:hypothetical protein
VLSARERPCWAGRLPSSPNPVPGDAVILSVILPTQHLQVSGCNWTQYPGRRDGPYAQFKGLRGIQMLSRAQEFKSPLGHSFSLEKAQVSGSAETAKMCLVIRP